MRDEGSPEQVSFEDALQELDGILRELEDGTTNLEDSLARYERGVGLIKHCFAKLSAAEQRIVQLTGIDEVDGPVTAPFTALKDDGGTRSRPAKQQSDSNGALPF